MLQQQSRLLGKKTNHVMFFKPVAISYQSILISPLTRFRLLLNHQLVTSNDATSNASENTAHDKVDGEHQKMRHGPDGKLTYQAVTNFLSSSSDLASSTSFFDDDETENDMEKMKQENYYDYDENLTEYSSILSSQQNSRLKIRKKPQRRKKRPNQQMSRTSSYSSITDSTMSLNIITVQINMDTVNFLGTFELNRK
jgi:hypothetical protein